MIQKRNRFSTNSQKSKKIALDFQPLANPKIENMKRRFILSKRRFTEIKRRFDMSETAFCFLPLTEAIIFIPLQTEKVLKTNS